MPLLGQIAWLMNAALIDRKNVSRPRLRCNRPWIGSTTGTRSLIAPEGTRSLTSRVGPFQEGRVSTWPLQGGVPIVPVIIQNTGELMWRGSSSIRSGTLHAIVARRGPPTTDAAQPLGQGRGVRQLYLDALEDWDGAVAKGQSGRVVSVNTVSPAMLMLP